MNIKSKLNKHTRIKLLLIFLRPKKIKILFINAKKEFKKNGFGGVLKRAHYLFNSPRHSILAYTEDEWKKNKRFSFNLNTKKFIYKKNKVSVIILCDRNNYFLTKEDMRVILNQSYKKYEIILVVFGYEIPENIKFAQANKKIKIFNYVSKYSKKMIIRKGIKESDGEFIIVLDKKIKLTKHFIKNAKNKKEYLINDEKLRANLPKKIAYIIPGIGISGGIAIVLNHTNRLLERGHDVIIISHNKHIKTNWLQNVVPIVQVTTKKQYLLDNIDIAIATHWSTAFYMDLLPAKRKIYFVQSDERRFNLENTEEIKSIETTYRIKCEYMTEAIWIQQWLNDEFGHNAFYVPNGLDAKMFYPIGKNKTKRSKLRVLLEGPLDVWFKGVKDAYNAIRDLDCEIWIISSSGNLNNSWRCDKFFNKVAMKDMKKIYSACDIFLKMSRIEGFFGPPMEAMACGCAVVVGKCTGYDEYIKDRHNALVIEQGDVEGAKKAVELLINDIVLRKKLIENGYKTVKKWGWNRSIDLLEKVIYGESPKIYYDKESLVQYNYQNEIAKLAKGKN